MIKRKQKPCKGINHAKGFDSCGETKWIVKYGLCKDCLRKFYLTTDKGKELLKKATLKAQKPRKDMEKAFEKKEQEHSLKNAKANTKGVVHAYVRERDKGKPCISCGTSWRPDFQAGHFKKAELYETLRYNTDNIHGQCPRCNLHLDGNVQKYADNLPNRIGKERFEKIMYLASIDKQFTKVWNIENLKEKRKEIKQLKLKLNGESYNADGKYQT